MEPTNKITELHSGEPGEEPFGEADKPVEPETPNDSRAEDVSIVAQMRELFDPAFYLAKYLDVARANAEPFEHYLNFGWREDRSPTKGFDAVFYREHHLSYDDEKMSPLEHYVRVGRDLGLPISRREDFLKNGQRYRTSALYKLLKASGICPPSLDAETFQTFLLPMFSADACRARRGLSSEVSDREALAQYLTFEFGSGVSPGPLFDDAVYREKARAADLPPIEHSDGAFLHWLKHGIASRIVPNAIFEEDEYTQRLAQVDSGFSGWVFEHFLTTGQYQDLRFSSLFFVPSDKHTTPPSFEPSRTNKFLSWLGQNPDALPLMEKNRAFLASGRLAELTAAAAEFEPLIGAKLGKDFRLYPPWQDGSYLDFQKIKQLIPVESAKRIILMPFGKMGGSDYLTGVLANLAGDPSDTLILRTEQPDWAFPAWFPKEAVTVDLSAELTKHDRAMRQRVIYELIRSLKAEHVYNCNSRAGFDTFAAYGARLAKFTRLYSYFYCSDFNEDGSEAGYPVSHFAQVAPHASATLFDSNYWREKLADRFGLTEELRGRMHSIYVPPKCDVPDEPLVHAQVASSESRERPRILWAGRLDRQKRFDVVLDVARQMPDVDFACWGRPVLDPDEYDLNDLPANVALHPPFEQIEDLPLTDADGWLYTSAWDGLPNMVIEVAACGVPIVASAVCGVPELINDATGWPVAENEPAESYVAALREMLNDKDDRIARATAAYDFVKERHTREQFVAGIARVEEGANG